MTSSSVRSRFNIVTELFLLLLLLALSSAQSQFEKGGRHSHRKLEKLQSSSIRDIRLQTSARVERLRISGSTCTGIRKEPILAMSSDCPCFIQYTIQARQTATWDVFVIPTTSFIRWRVSQFFGNPLDIAEEYSTLNKTLPAFERFETQDKNAMIKGDFTIAMRATADETVCLSDESPSGGTSIVFEPIPTPCPLELPLNETEPRIVGGTDVTGGFGWMAVIWLVASSAPMPVCGGVHISPGYIATAAHCEVQGAPHAFQVRVGTLRAEEGELIGIRRVFTHPQYRTLESEEAINDVAIIELLSVPERPTLRTNTDDSQPQPQSWVSTAGFGYISEDWTALPQPNKLQRVDVKIVGEECEDSYNDVNPELHICAGRVEGGCDSCLSDSGGPLVGLVNESTTLIGIVSYGNGCARSGTPGVYTRMSAVAGWTERTVQEARRTRQGPPVRVLVGGLVGGLIGLCVIAGIVAIVVRRKRRKTPVVRTGSSVPSESGISG